MTTQLPAHAPAMMSWDSGMSRRGEGEEGLRMRIGKTLLRGEGGRGGEWWGGERVAMACTIAPDAGVGIA